MKVLEEQAFSREVLSSILAYMFQNAFNENIQLKLDIPICLLVVCIAQINDEFISCKNPLGILFSRH